MEQYEYEQAIGRLVLLKEILTANHRTKVNDLIEDLVRECMGYED